jgi:hypothetical protein
MTARPDLYQPVLAQDNKRPRSTESGSAISTQSPVGIDPCGVFVALFYEMYLGCVRNQLWVPVAGESPKSHQETLALRRRESDGVWHDRDLIGWQIKAAHGSEMHRQLRTRS